MKEPLTLPQSKDEVAKKYGYKDWISVDFYELDALQCTQVNPYAKERLSNEAAILHKQSFIDSLRGKIQNEIKPALGGYRASFNGGLEKALEILTLLNETSGETGK